MMNLTIFFVSLIAASYAQDSVKVSVSANGTSENVKVVEKAVAEAIVTIEEACKKGDDVALVAQSAAKKVVEAAAEATASGIIQIQSTGNARGSGATSVLSESKATAIAEAIASAIVAVKDGPAINTRTNAIKEVTKTAQAQISQLVEVAGDAQALAVALSYAKVFVAAVAEALVQAAAKCENGIGSVTAAVNATVEEIAAPTDIKNTFVNAAVLASDGGFAFIRNNEAFAKVFGGSVPGLPPTSPGVSPGASPSPSSSPEASQLPAPQGATPASAEVFTGLSTQLGALVGSLRG